MTVQIPENTSKNTHNVVAELLLAEQDIKRVLDIPSGAGAFTKRLLDKGIEVHSCDIENILQVENPNFGTGDMNEPLPYEDNYFSAVVCIDGIEHLENPFLFVREACRVLQPGGVFIISTPNASALRSRWRFLLTGHHNKCKLPLNEAEPTPLHHINMMPFHRLRYILHSTGFQLDQVSTNRVKGISYVYFWLYPFARLFSLLVYSREKNTGQRTRNKTILKQMYSMPVAFGETLIVKARKP